MRKFSLIFLVLVLFVSTGKIFAQKAGEIPLQPETKDTVIIFGAVQPLIENEHSANALRSAWGIDAIFSGNGFGAGVFYFKELSANTFGFVDLGMSGAQNQDEFEQYDYYSGQYYVPGKINRIYMFPLMVGLQFRVFKESLSESFRPFAQAGIGPTFIVSTPYDREFFNAFGHSQSFTRAGGFVGVGAYFGSNPKSLTSVNVRYYIIPFGGNGLESIAGSPITNFGGLFLSLSFGFLK